MTAAAVYRPRLSCRCGLVSIEFDPRTSSDLLRQLRTLPFDLVSRALTRTYCKSCGDEVAVTAGDLLGAAQPPLAIPAAR